MRPHSWFILHRWRAKLASLVLATILWLVIKRGIVYSPALPPPGPPPPLVAVPPRSP